MKMLEPMSPEVIKDFLRRERDCIVREFGMMPDDRQQEFIASSKTMDEVLNRINIIKQECIETMHAGAGI